MKAFVILCMLIGVAVAQEVYAPIPYSFNYNAPTEDGGNSARQESGDGSGRVTGSYTVNDVEGHSRTVDYVADEAGFRVNVRSNEPGTANLNPADVNMESSAEANPISYSLGAAAPPPESSPPPPRSPPQAGPA